MTFTLRETVRKIPCKPLEADHVGRRFIRNPVKDFCTECNDHTPDELTIHKILQVAVLLIKIAGETLQFNRVGGTSFTHHNDGGWIPLKDLWEYVPELGFSLERIDPDSGARERLRYKFDIHQILTTDDLGKKVIRSQPYPDWRLDWAYIPPDEKLGDVEQILTEISEEGVGIFCLRTKQQVHGIFPNDGRWITEEFFRKYLDEHPDAVIPIKARPGCGNVDCTIS